MHTKTSPNMGNAHTMDPTYDMFVHENKIVYDILSKQFLKIHSVVLYKSVKVI